MPGSEFVNPVIVWVACGIEVVQAQSPRHALKSLEALHDSARASVVEAHLPRRNSCAEGFEVHAASVSSGGEHSIGVGHEGVFQLDDGMRRKRLDERNVNVLWTSLEAHHYFNVLQVHWYKVDELKGRGGRRCHADDRIGTIPKRGDLRLTIPVNEDTRASV